MKRISPVVASAVLALAGCSSQTALTVVKVSILSPTEGQTLRAADDVDGAQAGLQINVSGASEGFATGAKGELSVDANPTGASVALASDGSWTFPAVSLPGGSHVLSVSVKGGDASATASVQVKVEEAPANASIELVLPVAGPLNKAADSEATLPGLQAAVKVKLGGVTAGTVRLCSGAAPAGAAACEKAPGRVLTEKKVGREQFVDLSATLPEGALELTAEVKDDFSKSLASSATVALSVDSVEPTLTFLAPADADTVVKNPFQVLVKSDAEEGQLVTVSGGAAPVSGKLDARGEAMLTVQGIEGAQKLTADVSDKAGNPAKTAQVSFTVDTTACALSIKSPTGALVVFNSANDNDSNPANGLQTNIVANTSDCKGRKGEIFVKELVNGVLQFVSHGSVTADALNGDLVFKDVPFKDGVKDVPVEVRLPDPGGNVATAGFLATVVLKGPDLVLSTDTSVRNRLTDRDYTTPGIQTQALVDATVVQGGTVYLCSTVANGGAPSPCRKGGFIISSVNKHTALQTQFFGVTLGDGVQTLTAEVVDSAGNITVSPGKTLTVDSALPVVTSFLIREDVNADGLLSSRELPAGVNATLEVKVTGAEGQLLTVFTKDGAGAALVSGTVSGGQVVLSAPLAAGAETLLAKVTSANGNPNVAATPVITNAPAHRSFTVDRTAPVLSVVAPAKAVLNKADDTVNPATDDLEITLDVSTDNPAGSQVSFAIDGATARTAVVAASHATLAVTLNQGAHSIVVTVADAAGNTTTITLALTVDTLAPAITINGPTASQKFTSYSVPVSVTVAGAEQGQVLTVSSSAKAGSVGSQAVDAAGNASFSVTVPNGVQTLSMAISDKAGNPAAAATVAVEVASSGCQIALTAPAKLPARYNAADDKDGNSSNGLQVDIVANTSDCKGRSADLFVGGTKVATVTADSTTGELRFSSVSFPDNAANVAVHIDMVDSGGIASSFPFTVAGVKLSKPSFATLTPALPAAGGLTYVAKGNPTINGTSIIQDTIDGGDAEAVFAVKVANAAGGILSFKVGATEIVNKPIVNDPEDFGTFTAILLQNTLGTLVVSATDTFGNVAQVSYPVVVDVQPPAAPVVSKVDLADNRAANVTLEWTSTGDDGSTGSNSGYDVRYLTSTIAGTSFTCPTLDATAFGTTAVKLTTVPAAGAAGVLTTMQVTKLPPLNCYAFAVRAVDEVGNVSPLTNVVAKANYWTESVVAATTTNTLYGLVLASGDFDGNGATDLLIAARSEAPAGAVYIYYGGATPAASSQVLNAASVTIPGSSPVRSALVTGELFGAAIAGGDVDGDGVDDIIVGATPFSGSLGRAFIFFGRKNQTIDPTGYVEIRGKTAGGRFGNTLKVLEDINKLPAPAVARKELVVGARSDGTTGHAYMFFGMSQAQWLAARSGVDSTTYAGLTVSYIPAGSASRTFVGAPGDGLGVRAGFASVGDLDGDGTPEFTVPASNDSSNHLYLFNGALVNAASSTVEIGPASAATFTDTGTVSGTQEGFGAVAIPGDFDRDGTPDLIIAHPIMNRVHLFKGSSVTKTLGSAPATTLTKGDVSTFFGSALAVGDLNNDGKPDLVASNNAGTTTSTGVATIWIYYNSGTSTPFSEPGSVLKVGAGASQVEIGDFNGDSRLDLAVGDSKDGGGKAHFYVP